MCPVMSTLVISKEERTVRSLERDPCVNKRFVIVCEGGEYKGVHKGTLS